MYILSDIKISKFFINFLFPFSKKVNKLVNKSTKCSYSIDSILYSSASSKRSSNNESFEEEPLTTSTEPQLKRLKVENRNPVEDVYCEVPLNLSTSCPSPLSSSSNVSAVSSSPQSPVLSNTTKTVNCILDKIVEDVNTKSLATDKKL